MYASLFLLLVASFYHEPLGFLSQTAPQEQGSTVEKQVVHPFVSFISRYGRTYRHGTREYEERFKLFNKRAAEVEAHNSRKGQLWTAEINALSDRTESELAQLRGWRGGALPRHMRNARQVPTTRTGATFLKQAAKAVIYPRDFSNWTMLTSIRTIRDQGGCGSCWAVAGGTVLDAHSEIHSPHGKHRSFSIQDIVSCVSNPHSCGGTGGCAGATVELAFDYAINHGLGTSQDNPYMAETGTCARIDENKNEVLAEGGDEVLDVAAPGVHFATLAPATGIGMKAWERLPENAYEPLLQAVYERGPVALSVSARPWSSYASGIFDGCEKDAVIDHAVTLVGFGEESSSRYWLVQNSWGPDWGEKGRIRMLRHSGEDQHCGMDRQPEVGTGCEGGPAEVRVCGMCGILYDNVVPHFK